MKLYKIEILKNNFIIVKKRKAFSKKGAKGVNLHIKQIRLLDIFDIIKSYLDVVNTYFAAAVNGSTVASWIATG